MWWAGQSLLSALRVSYLLSSSMRVMRSRLSPQGAPYEPAQQSTNKTLHELLTLDDDDLQRGHFCDAKTQRTQHLRPVPLAPNIDEQRRNLRVRQRTTAEFTSGVVEEDW